jgi:hypothetical protein
MRRTQIFADRDTSRMLDVGAVGGAMFIILGALVCLCALAGTAWWFWIQARDHPRQPTKYRIFINRGLLTVLPTLAVFAISYYVIIGNNDRYYYGPEDVIDLLAVVLAVFILLYAVFRGDCITSTKQLPPVLALSLALAAGLALVEMGRQARGKGYNDMTSSAIMTDWEAIDEDTSLVTVQYSTDKGQDCTVGIRMDCTKFWQDIERAYEEGDDDGEDVDDEYGGYFEGHFYWKEDNYESLITSEVKYSKGDDDDQPIFTCRDGPTDQQNRRHLEDYYAYNNNQYQYDDAQQRNNDDDAEGYFTVSNILVNSHVCTAGFYSNKAMDDEYIRRTPESSMILCAVAAVVVGLVFGGWSLCPSENGSEVEEVNATGFVPAPDGVSGIKGVQQDCSRSPIL